MSHPTTPTQSYSPTYMLIRSLQFIFVSCAAIFVDPKGLYSGDLQPPDELSLQYMFTKPLAWVTISVSCGAREIEGTFYVKHVVHGWPEYQVVNTRPGTKVIDYLWREFSNNVTQYCPKYKPVDDFRKLVYWHSADALNVSIGGNLMTLRPGV